jgi:hypothetical protein
MPVHGGEDSKGHYEQWASTEPSIAAKMLRKRLRNKDVPLMQMDIAENIIFRKEGESNGGKH